MDRQLYIFCLFIHELIDICFHFLTIMKNDAMNIHVTSFCVDICFLFSVLLGVYLGVLLLIYVSSLL